MSRLTALALALVGMCAIASAQPTNPSFYGRMDLQSSNCLSVGVLLVGDVNGDGFPDLVCSTVLLGNGDGTFRTGQSLDLEGVDPFIYGALSDVNGDGNLDVVYPTYDDHDGGATMEFGFNRGNGDGTFQTPVVVSSSVAGTGPFAVGVADVNGDGEPDVVEVGTDYGVVYFGNGIGSFSVGPRLTVGGSGGGLLSLIIADLNRDGKADLVVFDFSNFYVLLGNGDGTFQAPLATTTPLTGIYSGAMAIGDVNGDGILDIAITDDINAYIYLGRGDGTFGSPAAVSLPGGNAGLALADVNGDGILDLVNNATEVAFGKGNGTFARPNYWPVAPDSPLDGYGSLAVADLRNDGRNDIITTDGVLSSVLLNNGKGAFEEAIRTTVPGGGTVCAAKGDFNGDGAPDIAIVVPSGIQIMLGTGNAAKPFEAGNLYPVTSPACPVVGDLNGDHIPDLLVPSRPYEGAGSVIAYLGNGDGTFTQGPSSPVSNIQVFTLADFNGDGKLDYATTSNLLAYGNGDGSFGTASSYIPYISPKTTNGFIDVVAGDLTGKAYPDIVLSDYYGAQLYVLYNEGTAGWKEAVYPIKGCGAIAQLAVGDVNGDGKPDIVGTVTSGLEVFLNEATSGFKQSTCLSTYQVDESGNGLPIISDVNGDGVTDLVWFDLGDAVVFLGEGSGTFAAPLFYGSGTLPAGAFALDLHHQSPLHGTPDLVEVDATGVLYTLINETK